MSSEKKLLQMPERCFEWSSPCCSVIFFTEA